MVNVVGASGSTPPAATSPPPSGSTPSTPPLSPSNGIEVPASVWGSMLGACRLHKEYEMVGEKMLELEPSNSGAYMILTEMHLHSDNRNEVANIFFMLLAEVELKIVEKKDDDLKMVE
ncbi:hypothetical protein Tco_0424580 [Tanacetum coccineum]